MPNFSAPVVFLLLVNSARSACAPQAAELPAAIDRGLKFLAAASLASKKEHKCASCHHAALVVWSMREAKERGHAVDKPALAELTKWVA